MEAEPGGPWLTPEAVTAGAGKVTGPRPFWWTGTSEDQFTPIYLSLAKPSRLHDALPPTVVDGMDLTTIWAFLGGNQHNDEQRTAIRAAQTAPDIQMVPLTPEEKAARLAARHAEDTRGTRRKGRSRG